MKTLNIVALLSLQRARRRTSFLRALGGDGRMSHQFRNNHSSETIFKWEEVILVWLTLSNDIVAQMVALDHPSAPTGGASTSTSPQPKSFNLYPIQLIPIQLFGQFTKLLRPQSVILLSTCSKEWFNIYVHICNNSGKCKGNVIDARPVRQFQRGRVVTIGQCSAM